MIVETASALIGLTDGALQLIDKLRKLGGSPQKASDDVLRLALIEAEHNLALLEVLKAHRDVASDDPRHFAYVRGLRLDAISAMLLEWKPVERTSSDWRDRLGVRPEWEKIAAEVDVADADRTLLSVARFIVVRGQALRALEAIDPAVRSKLNMRARLRNLGAAHRVLRDALRSRDVLEYLTYSRAT